MIKRSKAPISDIGQCVCHGIDYQRPFLEVTGVLGYLHKRLELFVAGTDPKVV